MSVLVTCYHYNYYYYYYYYYYYFYYYSMCVSVYVSEWSSVCGRVCTARDAHA